LSQNLKLTTEIRSKHNFSFHQIVRSLDAKTLNVASIKRLLQQKIKTTSIVVAVLDIPGKTTMKIPPESLPGLRPWRPERIILSVVLLQLLMLESFLFLL